MGNTDASSGVNEILRLTESFGPLTIFVDLILRLTQSALMCSIGNTIDKSVASKQHSSNLDFKADTGAIAISGMLGAAAGRSRFPLKNNDLFLPAVRPYISRLNVRRVNTLLRFER